MTLDYSSDELSALVDKVRTHFSTEFELEIGRFEAEEFLEFITGLVGPHFYNRGLYDAQSALMAKIDDINDAIYQLEQRDDAG
ncbi:DUF2164 domain-containing protein [Rhizobium halophytocola]|uniref:Uncharacterized protein (DUF2164 family) n=1 Tax=Rhizobium halophytocola TaxID=735519 RepID=A0ABS4E2Z7_9HYPH|nr:DUF2164 domain-containing protein [Rhizobium halophytocola]MBP1852302.1 uncharacterized protein (DUF2164 family) [Rhizobium halophytocola]